MYLRCPIDRLVGQIANFVVPTCAGRRDSEFSWSAVADWLRIFTWERLRHRPACTNNRQSRGRPRKRKGAQNKSRPSYLFSANLFSAELLQFVVTNRPRRLAHWTADLPPDESGYAQRCPESVCPRIRKLRVTAALRHERIALGGERSELSFDVGVGGVVGTFQSDCGRVKSGEA